MSTKLLDYFSEVTDPRVERTKLHKLEDILAIAICAIICGAEGWYEMAFFGQCKQQWLIWNDLCQVPRFNYFCSLLHFFNDTSRCRLLRQ